MSDPTFEYIIRLPFVPRPVNPEWLGSKFLATLDALTRIDPNIFPDWEIGDLPAMKGYPLAAARSRIAEIIGHNVSRDKSGFSAVAHTTSNARSRRMTFWVQTRIGQMRLVAGDYKVAPDRTIITFPLFKATLLSINAIWQQPWACAQVFRSRSAKIPIEGGGYELEGLPMIPEDPSFPESIFHIPWFAYLSGPLAVSVELPPEIKIEHTVDGGLLIIATESRLDPDNPEHRRSARVIAETMITCSGWKPRGGAQP